MELKNKNVFVTGSTHRKDWLWLALQSQLQCCLNGRSEISEDLLAQFAV